MPSTTAIFPKPLQHPSFHLHPHLPLPLLLSRHNLKRLPLLLPRSRRPLLRNLAPRPTAPTLTRITRRRPEPRHAMASTGAGNLALVGEFAAADEFLGEATAVEGLGGGIDGVGDDVEFRGELEELGDEFGDCGGERG